MKDSLYLVIKNYVKPLLLCVAVFVGALTVGAQGVKPLPSLHVEGKWLVDQHGNHVVLHGVMDTPSAWFNNGRWGWDYNDDGRERCLDYFEKLFTAFEKAKCTVFRLHLEPAWTNSNSYTYPGSAGQPSDASGEADIKHFSPSRLTTYLETLYFPLMQRAMKHGLYVVVRPPGVCPGNLKVGDYYQKYLLDVWNRFTLNDSIRKYSGQISIELANEPVNIKSSLNADSKTAMRDYFQPVVNKIRANGFTGIIWVPGTGWQSNYADYKSYPIEGYNIGYAVHDYDGWYGCADKNLTDSNLEQAKRNKISQFLKQVPVVETNPIIITEIDWSPTKPGSGHYNEHGDWVESNYGTWATGRTSKWGAVFKAVHDHYGNISMTLSGSHCLIDVDELLASGKVVPAFGGLEEACGKACMDWYAEWYNVNYPKADFASVPVSDMGDKFQNPIVRADFPDPDVIRVGDTYYMVSTTMHNFPGATILKSQDMVNWEYCAHPLKKLSAKSGYNLAGTTNAYASGMWACSMKYHNGKFHILINEKLPVDGWNLQGWLLTATNPEGEWEMKKLSRSYYDPGMLFDNGKVYVAQGIGNISVCELDENFNFKREKTVISGKDGLEGSHFYKIGDYYYIYATYGGWPSGQAAFRSKDPFGPYEEKMLVEKWYDGAANTIHQGALIEDVDGKWWTIMQEDLGALGRFPNLQPVKWVDDWPVVGNNGKPYKSFDSKIAKPKAVGDIAVKRLPTTDVFRTYPLGPQWEWNHNPVDTAWTLFDRPGWLRLKAVSKTTLLPQVRNMLTQRIFAIPNKYTTGTVRLDVRGLKEGDRAGICILQDPYAMVAVEVADGKCRMYWEQDKVRDAGSDFKAASKTVDFTMPDDSVVYLRASIKYGENKAKFYYSLDNKTWKTIGSPTSQSFNLSVFVGARFGLFCYGTKAKGGIADFDWFTTENKFSETDYYPSGFKAPAESQYRVTKIAQTPSTIETRVGANTVPALKATYDDGHKELVTAYTSLVPEDEGIVEFHQGKMLGVGQGSTKVNATYTDLLGNTVETSFTAKSSYFPLTYDYVKSDLAGNGSFRSTNTYGAFKFVNTDSRMGWFFDTKFDMSEYKYLVVRLSSASKGGCFLNIYTTQNLTGTSFTSQEIKDMEFVIDLDTCKYTSKSSFGKALNRKNTRIVAFSSATANNTLSVKEVFLSNDPIYCKEEAVGIKTVRTADAEGDRVSVYTPAGQLLRRSVSRSQATQGLRPGVYVVGKRKVVVK